MLKLQFFSSTKEVKFRECSGRVSTYRPLMLTNPIRTPTQSGKKCLFSVTFDTDTTPNSKFCIHKRGSFHQSAKYIIKTTNPLSASCVRSRPCDNIHHRGCAQENKKSRAEQTILWAYPYKY